MSGSVSASPSGTHRATTSRHLLPLLNLADFAADEEVSTRPRWSSTCSYSTSASTSGAFAGSAGRAYFEHKNCVWEQSVRDSAELLFGARGHYVGMDNAAIFLQPRRPTGHRTQSLRSGGGRRRGRRAAAASRSPSTRRRNTASASARRTTWSSGGAAGPTRRSRRSSARTRSRPTTDCSRRRRSRTSSR